ncbi:MULTISPECIES: nuclear transport factor 2 family protein [Eubacterium]|uniref:SnoaL-like domain-containing protein n=1 Tax=Eubacterium aggregans TaxID=81409 RepID=A0A1H4CFR7_9FIRM|nr:nuclear transport factor 2 family protein [Eubacterium aggregans]MDD4692547.1 nuclear transport factor 2 family protein [Eubacterium aggregans]SEA59194.1 SnoaL-like domain-containing protein [Eubacterium aggregans]
MAKKEAIQRYTEEILQDYFHGDSQTLFRYAHEDCSWIGPEEPAFARGLSAMRQSITATRDARQLGELYFQAAVSRDYGEVFLVSYNFCLRALHPSDKNPDQPYRASFVWLQETPRPQLMHGALSRALGLATEEEFFPATIGRANFNILKSYLAQCKAKALPQRLALKTIDGQVVFLHPMDILWIRWKDGHTQVHAKSALLELNRPFRRILSALPPYFFPLGRSIAINRFFIDTFEEDTVILTNGSQLTLDWQSIQSLQTVLAEGGSCETSID